MFLQLFDPESSTWTYLLGDEASGEAVLIDPVLPQLERDLALLAAHGLRLAAIVDTHVHADHITGAASLKAATGAPTAVGADCLADGYDRALFDGDTVAFGDAAPVMWSAWTWVSTMAASRRPCAASSARSRSSCGSTGSISTASPLASSPSR